MSTDVLFELGTEELPSGAVWPLATALAINLTDAFTKASISFGEVRPFATPRRLAVLLCGVAEKQANQTIARRGPPCASTTDADGKPTQALLGFAKSCGVALDALTKVLTDKGEWWVYEAEKEGALTKDLLPELIRDAVLALPIAKPMRWGSGDREFARPVHWALLLYGKEVIACDVLGLKTGNTTRGHRFHHPEPIEIESPLVYESLLNAAFVIADFGVRREKLVKDIHQLAKSHGYHAVMPELLVDEVTSIVEWPKPLMVHFDRVFLEVPPEVLIAAMQSHQKCFALRDDAGELVPYFITVANIESKSPSDVIHGNEKVMRARLSDAAFFYHQDRKEPLSHYASLTANVVFQAQLGSLQDKTTRLGAVLTHLVQPLQLDSTQALRAAYLSKCDLMSGMVGEFPELQGLMGSYYARNDKEDEAVALALYEQYLPRFAADELPSSTLGLALSLADRLDTLVGNFAIGQKPTGVKDPFKLRRHALAVLRMLIATPVPLRLSSLIAECAVFYSEKLTVSKASQDEVFAFILDRLPSLYQGQHIPQDVVQAVCARENDWLFDVDNRVKALLAFTSTKDAAQLSHACKRVNHLLHQASLTLNSDALDEALLQEVAEKDLLREIKVVEARVSPLYALSEYAGILSNLASLRPFVDAFFTNVMVMVDEAALKTNRLCLLSRLQKLLQGVADISLLQLTP